jgi:hypothetical protein
MGCSLDAPRRRRVRPRRATPVHDLRSRPVNRSSRIDVHHRRDWRLRAHHIDRPAGSHRPGPPCKLIGRAIPPCSSARVVPLHRDALRRAGSPTRRRRRCFATTGTSNDTPRRRSPARRRRSDVSRKAGSVNIPGEGESTAKPYARRNIDSSAYLTHAGSTIRSRARSTDRALHPRACGGRDAGQIAVRFFVSGWHLREGNLDSAGSSGRWEVPCGYGAGPGSTWSAVRAAGCIVPA